MIEPYGSVVRSFWTDPDIKRPLVPDAKLLLLYFATSPHGNMIGLYHCPLEYVATETGLSIGRVRELVWGALGPFLWYDETTEEVLVLGAAKHQVPNLKGPTTADKEDHRRKGVLRLLGSAHSPTLVRRFLSKYAEWDLGKALPDAPDVAPKPLPRALEAPWTSGTEQEQEQNSSVASLPASRPDDDLTDGAVLAHVRNTLWPPDGKAPPDWTEGQEIGVIRAVRKSGATGHQLLTVIDGLAILQERGDISWLKRGCKVTLKAVYNTKSGLRDTYSLALEAGLKHGRPPPRRGGTAALSDVLAQMR